MRSIYISVAFAPCVLLVLATDSDSADFELRPTIIESSVSSDWSGVYAGVHIGSIMSRGDIELGDYFGVLIPLDITNGLFYEEASSNHEAFGAGFTLGYNEQYGEYVFGVEADYTFTSLDADHHLERIDPNPVFPFFGQNTISDYRTNFEDIITLRMRAGATYGDTLFYATGGLAAANVSNSFSIAIPGIGYASPTDWYDNGMAWGFAVGAGLEHKLSDDVSIKSELIYIDLENRTVSGTDPVNFPGEGISYEFKNNLAIARVGMNVAF